jgi:MraZ protein
MIITHAKPVEINGEVHRGLIIFPGLQWQKLENNIERVNYDQVTKAALLRNFIAPASECVMDKRGRIRIPLHLRTHGDLNYEQDIVFVGKMDLFELWNMNTWAKVQVAHIPFPISMKAGHEVVF